MVASGSAAASAISWSTRKASFCMPVSMSPTCTTAAPLSACAAGLNKAHPEIEVLFADMGYQGLEPWSKAALGWRLIIVKRPAKWVWAPVDAPPPALPSGFHVLPKRWIVERTFAWLTRNRRLTKDWERLSTTSETWIYLAMSRLMAKRLAKADA